MKSYGELSSIEYDDLINQLWTATKAGNLDECFVLIKKGAWVNHQRVGSCLQVCMIGLMKRGWRRRATDRKKERQTDR